MLKRTLVAVPFVAVVLLCLYMGGWVLRALVILVASVSLWEFYNALGHMGYKPFRWSAMAVAVLAIPLGELLGAKAVLALLALSASVLFSVRVFSRQYGFVDIALSATAFVYPLLPFGLAAVMLHGEGYTGSFLLLAACAYAVLTDTFAYLVGSFWGKHKMCVTISPKKTWEGAAGGVLGALASGAALYALQALADISLHWYDYLVMGLLCGVTAQVGDLFASTIKREAALKDFGNCFPGHGGMMDRLDSVLFTIPVVFTYGVCIGLC